MTLLTKELKAAFKQHPLDATLGDLGDALCLAIFSAGPIRWYVFEGSKCGTNDYLMTAIVTNWIEDEIGYVSLHELQQMQAISAPDFVACPLKDINGDTRLTQLLNKFKK